MFGRILVPLDGSALAASALPYVEIMAKSTGASLVLVRAVTVGALLGARLDEQELHPVAESEQYLDGVAERLRSLGLTVETVAREGEPAETILETARAKRVDLIAMATHGRTGLGRILLGSIADEVMRHSTLPVLLVPSRCEQLPSTRQAPRILVPLDGSARSEAILGPASDLASALRAELVLLEVARASKVAYDPASVRARALGFESGAVTGLRDKAEDHLELTANALRAAGHAVETNAVIGTPPDTIVAEARAQRANLIAMATHGRGGLERLVLGSVAQGVLSRAHLPLLLIRPTDLQPEPAGS